jgi:hypothetical protein
MAGKPVILIEDFSGFPQSVKINSETVSPVRSRPLLLTQFSEYMPSTYHLSIQCSELRGNGNVLNKPYINELRKEM